ncbi:MAG: type II toxin-antitoxin system PemK/MazF family toxin, partial [Mycobacterium sp.]
MASTGNTPKTRWETVQRFVEKLVFDDAPKLIRQLQDAPSLQQGIQRGIAQGIKIGMDALAGAVSEPPPAIPAGRPVTSASAPTAHRARKLCYAPDLNGRADPGEIVWAWVVYS